MNKITRIDNWGSGGRIETTNNATYTGKFVSGCPLLSRPSGATDFVNVNSNGLIRYMRSNGPLQKAVQLCGSDLCPATLDANCEIQANPEVRVGKVKWWWM